MKIVPVNIPAPLTCLMGIIFMFGSPIVAVELSMYYLAPLLFFGLYMFICSIGTDEVSETNFVIPHSLDRKRNRRRRAIDKSKIEIKELMHNLDKDDHMMEALSGQLKQLNIVEDRLENEKFREKVNNAYKKSCDIVDREIGVKNSKKELES